MSAALNAYSPQDPMIGNDGFLPLPTSRHAPHYLPIPFGASDTFWHVPILFGASRTIWRLSPRARTRQHEYPKFGCPTPLPAGTAQQTRRKQILSDLAFRSDFGHTKGRPLCIKMSVPSVELGGFEPPTSSMPWKRATNCAIAPSSFIHHCRGDPLTIAASDPKNKIEAQCQ